MLQVNRIALLIVASAALAGAQTDPPGRVGRLNYMEGPVSFQPAGIDDWVDADVNRPLIPGDNVWVGDRGRAELHVGSTALRLGGNTAFQFLNLDDETVQIRLSEGSLTVRVRSLGQNQFFEVDTPNLAFTLDRPGEYRIDANPDSQTTIVTVRDGEGEVTGGGQAFPVYARQRAVVRGDDQINYNLATAGGADEFDQWCSTRDRREDQSPSARYVSREIAGYDDLDQYGRWDNQPGYGQVWMPTSVGAGWAPYHDGHWAWIAPWGWTWVDDAPWGFAPYHYGRWASFGGRWGWVPGPYGVTPIYAPALVAWIGGGGRGGSSFSLSFSIGSAPAIGWFPLGPREPYFPSYQVSERYFTRVNNTNTVINNTTINNYYNYSRNSNNTAITNIQYVNRNVQNGVTAMPQDNFSRGRRVTQDARAVTSAQLGSAQVFAAPTIAPRRESVLGVRADTAARAPRPPANVLSRPVVARRAPPPAPVAFDRQQPALAQNPGRPLPTNTVQEMRQSAPAPRAPVRVVDMDRIKRVQPVVGAEPQRGQQPNVPQPATTERRNAPPGQQRQQQEVARPQLERPQPPAIERQPQATPPPQADRPQPPVTERQNVPPGRQRQQQEGVRPQVAQPQVERPQPPVIERQQPSPQVERPQPPVTERQNGPPGRQRQQQEVVRPQGERPQVERPQPPVVERPQPPAVERQNVPPGRQRQQQAEPRQAERPQTPVVERQSAPPGRQQPPPQAAPPPVERQQPPATDRQQRQDKGNQQRPVREDDDEKKPKK